MTKQDNIEYWDDDKALIQVDSDKEKLGLSCQPDLAINSDAGVFMEQLLEKIDQNPRNGLETAIKENKLLQKLLKNPA